MGSNRINLLLSPESFRVRWRSEPNERGQNRSNEQMLVVRFQWDCWYSKYSHTSVCNDIDHQTSHLDWESENHATHIFLLLTLFLTYRARYSLLFYGIRRVTGSSNERHCPPSDQWKRFVRTERGFSSITFSSPIDRTNCIHRLLHIRQDMCKIHQGYLIKLIKLEDSWRELETDRKWSTMNLFSVIFQSQRWQSFLFPPLACWNRSRGRRRRPFA